MYKKTIQALNDVKTLSSHITNIVKIRNQTEDEQLRDFLLKLIAILQAMYLDPNIKKSMPFSLMQNGKNIQEIQNIVTYCSKFIAQDKPEWQVLAEKNGWGPR